jgi:hypothetical protein
LRHKGIAKQSKEKGDKRVFREVTRLLIDGFLILRFLKSAIPEISKFPNI